jgi:hypothetical protein
MPIEEMDPPESCVDLYWIPLGAGGAVPVVHWNGLLFAATAARRAGRPPRPLFHAALAVRHDHVPFTIEMTPVWGNGRGERGVVAEGPVGMPWLGRSRLFRYEVRRWRHGVIPDVAYAVGGRNRLSTDARTAMSVLDLAARFPTATWGRDELRTGDMWNSNSLVAWLLARSGIDARSVAPPDHGRAPGWSAGLTVAAR